MTKKGVDIMLDMNIDNFFDVAFSSLYTEASSTTKSSKVFITRFGPRIEAILSTPAGSNKFKKLVGEFIDRNGPKLLIPGPTYQILFTPEEKLKYYTLFKISEAELNEAINEVTKAMNAESNWRLIRGNPIFVLFTLAICIYQKLKNESGINIACAILVLSMYPSMFSVFFKFPPNPAIMNYTIDNLTNKFAIKKSDHLFDMLTKMVRTGYEFHKKNLATGEDAKIIAFILRVRNDFKSAMKKITNEFMQNHAQGKGLYVQSDSYSDNQMADLENDTNKVASVANKVAMGLAVDGPDSTLAAAAATASGVSVNDFRNYLSFVCDAKHSEEISEMAERIMVTFLYEGRKKIDEIHTRDFLSFSVSLYKKSNSKNENVDAVKKILDKWVKEVGVSAMYSRVATLVNYKKAFYVFMIFSIQKYA